METVNVGTENQINRNIELGSSQQVNKQVKKTGAQLAVYALEQVGVKFTFGIPGVHNTEIYDELNKSKKIEPVLVTHEQGGAFMAEGISRTSDHIGCLAIVPGAGATHAMSGIGEAYLDGIPLLVISGGTRRDSGRHYQLHQMDQTKFLNGITKGAWVCKSHEEIIPTIYRAYETAIAGTPGPAFVELPAELLLFQNQAELKPYRTRNLKPQLDRSLIQQAVSEIKKAKKPGLYLGWGARDCQKELQELAELLGSPVSTTMQGISVFSAKERLHTGMGFGVSGVPAAENAFKDCDCLVTIGARFGELATGSFGIEVPDNLIHSDINSEVFNKNYPARVAIQGDAKDVVVALIDELRNANYQTPVDVDALAQQIKKDKADYLAEWTKSKNDKRVSPGHFFKHLRSKLDDDAFVVLDDGNHTFLAAEQFPVYHSKSMISPTDFNAMGYCVPATIGVKLSHPNRQAVGVVGDGGFLMTCMEILTASTLNLGAVFFVFYDGELGQISQFQKVPLNRKTCTIIGNMKIEGVAQATGAAFLEMLNDDQIEETIDRALEISKKGQPVIVDVKIDYSKKTKLTKGVVKTNLGRFPLGEKIRFIGRAAKRHILG